MTDYKVFMLDIAYRFLFFLREKLELTLQTNFTRSAIAKKEIGALWYIHMYFNMYLDSKFSGVCATRSLILCVCFVDRCLSFCPPVFYFLFWSFYPSSIYRFL